MTAPLDEVWRHHLRIILDDPSYSPKGATTNWVNDLWQWFVQRFHLRFGIGHAPTSLLWIALVIVLLVIAMVLVSLSGNRRLRGQTTPADCSQPNHWSLWIARANASMARANWDAAARELFQAALTYLEFSGQVCVSPDTTNGEYARELRRNGSPFALSFRHVARTCDELWYSADDSHDAAALVQRLHQQVQVILAQEGGAR